ncbi:MAG: glycerate kinase, partial [Betaproteobacteria bacterium]|nr:glycerate kinase [Betaproteobacteria bacterium]
SGPCAPDASTFASALRVLDRYGIDAPAAVQAHLRRGQRSEIGETPKPGDRAFARVENRVIVTSQDALQAAAGYFRAHGMTAAVLGDSVSGEAAGVAGMQAAMARQVALHSQPWAPPVALISGGECTVTVRGDGRGGRCSEFLLALGIALEGVPNVCALACDTDGLDGTETNAGALLTPDTLTHARRLGVDPAATLSGNDSWRLFSATGDLVVTGPTRTNVNDYRVILVLPV